MARCMKCLLILALAFGTVHVVHAKIGDLGPSSTLGEAGLASDIPGLSGDGLSGDGLGENWAAPGDGLFRLPVDSTRKGIVNGGWELFDIPSAEKGR